MATVIGMGGLAAMVSLYKIAFRLSPLAGLGKGGACFMTAHLGAYLTLHLPPATSVACQLRDVKVSCKSSIATNDGQISLQYSFIQGYLDIDAFTNQGLAARVLVTISKMPVAAANLSKTSMPAPGQTLYILSALPV